MLLSVCYCLGVLCYKLLLLHFSGLVRNVACKNLAALLVVQFIVFIKEMIDALS